MEKICIISPIKSTSSFTNLLEEVKEICENKYDFEIIALCEQKVEDLIKFDEKIKYINVDEKMTLNEKFTIGMEQATVYDVVALIDYENENWKEYLQGLILSYENGADISYVKYEISKNTIWGKIKRFFSKINNCIYEIFIKLFAKTKDLCVYNSFQLYKKDIVDIIRNFPEKNSFLRNFDCWTGYKSKYIITFKKEPRDKNNKLCTKSLILDFICLSFLIGLIVLSILLYPKVSYDFRFTYVALAIALCLFLFGFSIYHFVKQLLEIKIGKSKSLKK